MATNNFLFFRRLRLPHLH